MLFSRGGAAEVPGTLPHALLGFDHPRAPDLLYVLGDAEGNDPAGLPGLGLTTAGDVPLGGGMHGGLHPRELGNVLLLAVPGAAAALRDAPAGLLDIATTVLGLLGIEPPGSMVGRNLAAPDPAVSTARHDAGDGAFAQWVELATVGRATYALGGGRG
jgi:arylsulfatase A-like enzyme